MLARQALRPRMTIEAKPKRMSLGDANVGLLLVGHGTRSDVGTQQFLELTDAVARRFSPLPR